MTKYRFKKVPGNFGLAKINKSKSLTPNDIYRYAKAFRSVYTHSMPILQKFGDPKWPSQNELEQLHGKAQSLAVQIAMSNELLLKAILLGSTGELTKGHDLKKLINRLDERYVKIIKEHLEENGLKDNHWDKVLKMSAQVFVSARYGFEPNNYDLDFRTLQLLNEALDDIFNNFLPDWTRLTKAQQENKERLKKEIDLIFDEDYQKEQAELMKLWSKALKD